MPAVPMSAVVEAVERILGSRVDGQPERQARGYGNENWRVEAGGSTYLVKVAAGETDLGKVTAASNAYRLAATTAAPVPRQVYFDPRCELLDRRTVRILEFLPGTHPDPDRLSGEAATTFFRSFGAAVAELHTAGCPAFSSRVGGGPSFPTWLGYLEYRIPQIVERCRTTGAFTAAETKVMFERVLTLAAEISDLVQPRLTHRDLYLDNVLIGDDGRISALLDLDSAEAWDPVVDFVKPRSQVFPSFPGSEAAFEAGYADAAGGLPAAFHRRVRIVEVIELSNHVANALATGATAYAAHNRRRLDAVLAADW